MELKIKGKTIKGRKPPPDDTRLIFDGQNLVGQDFSGRSLAQLSSVGCSFLKCHFDNITATSVCFGAGKKMSSYEQCSFNGSKMKFSAVGIARFVDCSFLDVSFENFECIAVDLIRCKFSGVLRNGRLCGAIDPLSRQLKMYQEKGVPNEIEDNDFSYAKFVDFEFRYGVDLSRQILPDQPEYVYVRDGQATLAKVKQSILADIKNPLIHREIMALIVPFEGLVADGQSQILLREDDFATMDHRARAYFFDLLRKLACGEGGAR